MNHPTFVYSHNVLKVDEARALIGKHVAWLSSEDVIRGQYFLDFGKVEDVVGRNVLFIDGTWKSLKELKGLQAV